MRSFNSEIGDLLDEGRMKYVGMIRFDLAEGSYGFIRRNVEYTYEGVLYKPMPKGMISVSSLPHTTGTAASGFSLVLAESPDDGLTPEILVQIESYGYRDRPVTIYDLFQHPDTHAILGNPIPQKSGYINRIVHDEDPDSGYLMTVECEGREIDYSRTNGRIRTTEDQERRATGDLFFEHTGTTGRVKLDWGKK
ncbi:DUF2163 domain-containing protein [Pseudohoeflea suaedae]|uniref:DUF2163 domain-containing protein n=1 Tax=Pseudohoeflea suaedae TaxID=877384 RepID=A0A4R5PKB3_9HYPH|nr:DUF2163 domain-containing protein [Pseudohoeflea suaedae]TDH35728.1 DUF2163 domain-containing protein [Pseudohoeflea suaedae]